jgi:hypothetical protein
MASDQVSAATATIQSLDGGASADTAVEWMIARCAYDAEPQRDGGWTIARLQINLEEIARATGFFPSGQRNGR